MDLAQIIADEIRADGPIPFRRFMELALYHPRLGYYAGRRDPFGTGGDFYTNAQLQPVFGRLLAQQIERWRRELGCPEDFSVLELGPGRGETETQVRKSIQDIDWIGVDYGDPWPRHPLTGVVLCNEFFDALPVDSVERTGDGWMLRGVGLQGERFCWQTVGPVPADEAWPDIERGRRTESCDGQVAALRRISAALRRGWILVIDYGYTRTEVERAGRFLDGSLMGYSRHRADPDVLLEPGRRDITAHVNFSALEDAAREAGLEVTPVTSQQAYLLGLGEPDSFACALAAESEREATRLRMQLKTLLFGLGETFRALVLRKR
ncbi:MAG: SAM-dependent methyltransferase [Bryobacterales bacterium]|nr:SAM-dependent methyltransferase [Bryobacterales bacterium]MDE0621179.1 SAM-dependent methyltransferase [Bryobacterales bacterium]